MPVITPTVTSLGLDGQTPSSTTFTNLVTATADLATPLFCVFNSSGGAGDAVTFTDSVGSVWNTDQTFIDAVNGTQTSIGTCQAAGTLASGVGVVTAHISNARINGNLFVFTVKGASLGRPIVDATNPLPGNTGHSASATPGSTTPKSQSTFGLNVIVNFFGTGTPPAGWTELFDSTTFGGFTFVQINYTTNLLQGVAPVNPAEAITLGDWYDLLALYESPPGRITAGQYTRQRGFSGR